MPENHQNRFFSPENNHLAHRYQMNHHRDSGLFMNPSYDSQLARLEEAIARISLSSLSSDFYSLNRMRGMSAGLGLLRGANSNMLNAPYQNRVNPNPHPRRSRRATDYEYRAGNSSSVRPINLHHYAGLMEPRRAGLMESRGSWSSSIQLDMKQVKGRIAALARTQEGSRWLQKKIDEQRSDQIEMIFAELKDHVCDLVVDQFANVVLQKLFTVCSEEQITQLLISLITNGQRFLNICIHQHGTRAVQKMIEQMRTREQRFAVVSALKFITVSLCKNNNGHHVIQQCFKCFLLDDTKCLLDEIASSCLEIAMDKSGCCVLQKSLTRAEGELKDRLLGEVAANALILSEHPYGNYVVQFVLEMRLPCAEDTVTERLSRNFVTLSMNKYGSNVVEKCMKHCREHNAAKIIQELMQSKDFLDVIQDPFGNYVIQTALNTYKGNNFYTLARVIDHYHPLLHSHLHGKKVLAVLTQNRGTRNGRIQLVN
ncbi:pumilio homolog 12-like [Euphorbia lathyris]|uniref:pumilio homolog 12-like n=1 Tax=Euphorbia lathyris TaxID=212925 RepID=UPI003313B6C2